MSLNDDERRELELLRKQNNETNKTTSSQFDKGASSVFTFKNFSDIALYFVLGIVFLGLWREFRSEDDLENMIGVVTTQMQEAFAGCELDGKNIKLCKCIVNDIGNRQISDLKSLYASMKNKDQLTHFRATASKQIMNQDDSKVVTNQYIKQAKFACGVN